MSVKETFKLIKDKEIEFVDLRFTDPRGKLQHLTMDATIVDDEMLEKGVFFDGSSIAGWKAINESDMILKPDLSRPIVDPFNSHNTLNIFCDILDAVKKDPYERDPRGTAKKAEAYLSKSGIGDKAYFGPEPEFFTFDDVRFKNDMNETSFMIDSAEGPYNSGKKFENGFWATVIKFDSKYKINVNSILKYLSKDNIFARPFFMPLSSQKAYKKFSDKKMDQIFKLKPEEIMKATGFAAIECEKNK